MSKVTLIAMAAGNSTRFREKRGPKKQWLQIGHDPLWLYVTKSVVEMFHFENILITASPDEYIYMKKQTVFEVIKGGESREASLRNALEHVTTPYVLVTDTARPCVPKHVIEEVLASREAGDCIVPFINAQDTTLLEERALPRENLRLIQTPQLSNTQKLRQAFAEGSGFTDESSAIAAIKGKIVYVRGAKESLKLTDPFDSHALPCLRPPVIEHRSGGGFDTHRFCEGRSMWLGGIEIDRKLGFLAHSDGDVLIHAIIDALLGAVGAGDIGEWFPDNDPAYSGADSKELLGRVVRFIDGIGFVINNVDATIIAQKPKISPHKEAIERSLASLLGVERGRVNIKATTAEKMGYLGREEGVAVLADATVQTYDWTNKDMCKDL